MTLALHLCDVFADRPLSGNSLSVVIHDEPLDTTFMQALTGELRQFETAFLSPTDQPGTFTTRVFDLHTELAFAGHPLLGAAAVLHSVHGTREREEWRLSIHGREVPLATTRGERPGRFITHMDQGVPAFLATADADQARRAACAFALDAGDLAPGVPLQVVSTGLRYLVVPIVSGLDRARVVHPRLQELLADLGAEFAYLIDVRQRAGLALGERWLARGHRDRKRRWRGRRLPGPPRPGGARRAHRAAPGGVRRPPECPARHRPRHPGGYHARRVVRTGDHDRPRRAVHDRQRRRARARRRVALRIRFRE